MPKSPHQIDEMIFEDIKQQRTILLRIERERVFHQRRVDELTKMDGCDHEVEFKDARLDRCKHCGYEWVR